MFTIFLCCRRHFVGFSDSVFETIAEIIDLFYSPFIYLKNESARSYNNSELGWIKSYEFALIALETFFYFSHGNIEKVPEFLKRFVGSRKSSSVEKILT